MNIFIANNGKGLSSPLKVQRRCKMRVTDEHISFCIWMLDMVMSKTE
jgi:hypothetical protein